MDSDLPATGTVALLELLAPLVPEDFINQAWPHGRPGGRHREHTAAQLFRVHLLSLLSPVHALNLLVKRLPEQRAWRTFAGLRRQNRVPDVWLLHEFRARLGGAGLRRINQHLLQPLVEAYAWRQWSVGLIDATDLPAACGDFKNKHRPLLGAPRRAGRAHAQEWAEPVLGRLQEAHAALVAARLHGRRAVGPLGQLGHAGQCVRRRAAGTQPALWPAAMGLVPAAGRGRHGLLGGRSQAAGPRPNARRATTDQPPTSLPCSTSPQANSGCLSSDSTENSGEPKNFRNTLLNVN